MIQKMILTLFALFSSVVFAQSVTVNGNNYPSISEAITAAEDGDVILISGVHTESITISKSITLRGINPTTDIIQAASEPSNSGLGSRVISLVRPETAVLNITIENLGIRHGNANLNSNGGGIDADKITGLLTLRNLIIENNFTARNGGALSFAGSNAEVVGCVIRNNSATLDGGAIIAAPNNASSTDNVVNIKQSLIDNNTGRNGGGIYLNGNNTFGNSYRLFFDVENSTISNNAAFSPAGGNGGGAVFVASAVWTGGGSNINLKFVHATTYNNSHAAANKAGLQFGGSGGTNFSAYNSIIVNTNDVAVKALNFVNSNTINVVNCILGGLNSAPALIDEVDKNNQKGRTATQAGLTGVLTNEGGTSQVLAISEGSSAVDFCTATTDVTIPTVDQRNYNRNGVQDAGAFELAGTLPNEAVIPAISPEFCGFTINSASYDEITLADDYEGELYEFTITNGETVVTIEKATPMVRFIDFGTSNFEYGTTYNLSVRVKIGDEYSEPSPACEVTLTANPLTSVENLCGQTVAGIHTKVYVFGVTQAASYRYSVKNVATNIEQLYVSNQRFFTFASLETFDFGTNYEVKAQVKIGNGEYGDFGDVCVLSSPENVTSKLRDEFCNTILTTLNQNIYATFLVGAEAYKFRISANGNSQEIERPDSRFSFGFALGITLNQVYNVEVAVKYNDVFGPYSDVCTVTTPASLPIISLRPQFCGATFSSSGSNFYAKFLVGATAYRFKTMINGEEVVVERPDSRCFMSAFAGAMMNQMYQMQVAAQVSGVWSEYGEPCALTYGTVDTSKVAQIQEEPKFSVFPNPSSTNFQLQFNQNIEQGTVEIFDLSGKMLQSVKMNQVQNLEFGNDLKTGIYLAKVQVDQTIKTIKLIKN
mgnify:CR=1 FL=1